MQEGTSTERVPSAVQITVRWGASILMAKRISPPKTMMLTGGVGKLELGTQGLDLVADGQRHRVVRGKRLKIVVDDVEIVIDATDDKLLMIPLAAAMDRRHMAADVGSFLLHAGALGFCFFWRTPLSHAETDVPELRQQVIEIQEKRDEPAPLPEQTLSASLDPAGASGAAPPQADRRPRAVSTPASFPQRSRDEQLSEAATFGMIGLLAQAEPTGAIAWGEEPLAPIGSDAAVRSMFGSSKDDGLTLSGVGEGAGGNAVTIGLGTFATCGEGCVATVGSSIVSIGRGQHGPKPPTVRMSGPHGVTGRLPAEAIQRIVRQSFGRFRHCYAQALVKNPALEARVTVSFVIGRDGSVTTASSSSESSSPALAPCVTKAFYGLSFPQPEGGVVNVTYPIRFSPEG